jgi:hypothetical protein
MRHMTSRNSTLFALLVFALAGGCRSASRQEVRNPAENFDALRAEIVRMQTQVRATETSLAELTRDPDASDLAQRFDRFSHEFDEMVTSAQRARDLAQEIRLRGRQLISAWARETGRADEVAERYEVLEARLVLARSALRPYMQALYDTIGFLRPEITPTRVADIHDMATESSATAEIVLARYDEIVGELEFLHATLAEVAAESKAAQ